MSRKPFSNLQDLSVRDRVAVKALMVVGLAQLDLHRPGHTAAPFVDRLLAGTTYYGLCCRCFPADSSPWGFCRVRLNINNL